MYELQSFDEKLDSIKNKFLIYKTKLKQGDKNVELSEEVNKLKEEYEIIREKHSHLKHQISGAKKKYFFDMRKIEDKMDRLFQIKKEVQEDLSANPKLKKTVPNELQTLDSFPDKIKTLMDSININLDTTFTRYEMVEEKLRESQDLLKLRKK